MNANLDVKIKALIENTDEIGESMKAVKGEAYQSAVFFCVNLINVVNTHRSLVCAEHPADMLDKVDMLSAKVIADGLYRLACLVAPGSTEKEIVGTYESMKKDVKVLVDKQRT